MGCIPSTIISKGKDGGGEVRYDEPQSRSRGADNKNGLSGPSNSAPEYVPPPELGLIRELTDGRPLDASDVKNLTSAKAELSFIRKFAKEYLDGLGLLESNINNNDDDEDDDDDDDNTIVTNKSKRAISSEENDEEYENIRHPLYDKQDFSSFKKTSYQKTPYTRALIRDAVRPNTLFEDSTEEEILEIVDIFKPRNYKRGECIIAQGSEGTEFFVVESGDLSIHVTVQAGLQEKSQIKVGDYSAGSAFGELALILGSPRASTITATTDCKLWILDCVSYISLISQLRHHEHIQKNEFLQTCEVRGQSFLSMFDPNQIENLAIATKVDTYQKGEIILREGEMGESFYIVKSGLVETYRLDRFGMEEKNAAIEQRKAFGTTSLLRGAVSEYTYIAATNVVTLYYLTKQDFEVIIGSFVEQMDGNTVASKPMGNRKTVETSMTYDRQYDDLDFKELNFFNILGRGAFGQVTLVQSKKTKKVFALKAQSKSYIVQKKNQDKVLNEFRILKDIKHPNILGIHCAMQDKSHLYFLMDLLPGEELMKHFRRRKKFTEDITRFYAASIVLAFEHMHDRDIPIAYRDLKPENIVLTRNGYAVLVDFGLAKEIINGQTYTFCGTPDYLAPEILRRTGHDWAVDYWCLGIFIFELTHGVAPFHAANQTRIGRKILQGVDFVRMPSYFSSGLSDLVSNLLISDQSRRLGRTYNGIRDIINHRWFAGCDWNGLMEPGPNEEHTTMPPIKPSLPADIKTLGKQQPEGKSETYPESEWWPKLGEL